MKYQPGDRVILDSPANGRDGMAGVVTEVHCMTAGTVYTVRVDGETLFATEDSLRPQRANAAFVKPDNGEDAR